MKRILMAFFTALLTISCSESFLDLEPISNATTQAFYNNADEIAIGLNAVYSSLQDGNAYGGEFLTLSENRSDNIQDNDPGINSGVRYAIDKFDDDAGNPILRGVWSSAFKTIFRANTVIDQIEKITLEDSLKNTFMAEAMFIRALTYFNLVRLWGNVPLLTRALTADEVRAIASRNSTIEIYAQIEQDLKFATKYLPDVHTSENSGKATADAARALLAKVLMTQNKFDEAIVELRSVTHSSLLKNIADVFDVNNELNEEIIFAIKFKADEPGEDHSRWLDPAFISTNLKNAYDNESDSRYKLLEPVGTPDVPLKLEDANRNGIRFGNDFPLIRYSDVLLMLAECLNEEDYVSDGEAFALINQVRERAGIPTLTSNLVSNQEAFRDIILKERRLEFALEGHRWFDLLRTGKAIQKMEEFGIQVQQYRLLYPIPQREIDTFQDRDRFPQNPGY